MSIHFISGKPGGGKSLLATMKLLQQLQETNRVIRTNLSLNLTAMQIYLDAKGLSINVLERVLPMTDEETARFYMFRKNDVPANGNLPDFAKYCAENTEAVCYILDELHIFFNARAWAKTGDGAIFYLSQHRKLDDIVFCVTQSIGNVDKQFRSVAQDFTYCRNERVEKFGAFRKGGGFIGKVYMSPVTGMNDQPSEQFAYKLDLAICELYDTSAGVGMTGSSSADKGAKAKGAPLWVIWLLIPVSLLVLWGVTQWILPKALGSGISHTMKDGFDATKKDERPAQTKPEEKRPQAMIGADGQPLKMVSFRSWRDKTGLTQSVTLSNGRRYSTADGLQSFGPNGAQINGVYYAAQTNERPRSDATR